MEGQELKSALAARQRCTPGPDRLRRSAMRKGSAEERFWDKVDRSGDCWLWMASKSAKGYGYFNLNGHTVRAHRYAYELANGPIPDGLQIDHQCRMTHCVNPEHLRLATNKQNSEHRGGRGARLHRSGKWQASVKHHGRDIYLGLYDSERDAELVATGARLVLFTHNDLDR